MTAQPNTFTPTPKGAREYNTCTFKVPLFFPNERSGLPAESEGLLRKKHPKTRLTPANKQVRMGADKERKINAHLYPSPKG